MDVQTQRPTRSNLQRLRELTRELDALTREMSEYATKLRTSHQRGRPRSPAAVTNADALLAKIARVTTLLREESQRLPGPSAAPALSIAAGAARPAPIVGDGESGRQSA
jgi:hypothetical protein